MAGKVQVHVTWVDLVRSTHLAAAFSYDSVDQIIGTCILLLYSLPAADKPSLVNPVALEWATAVDRHRYEVHSSTQVRKHHEKGMHTRPNRTPGSGGADPPTAMRWRQSIRIISPPRTCREPRTGRDGHARVHPHSPREPPSSREARTGGRGTMFLAGRRPPRNHRPHWQHTEGNTNGTGGPPPIHNHAAPRQRCCSARGSYGCVQARTNCGDSRRRHATPGPSGARGCEGYSWGYSPVLTQTQISHMNIAQACTQCMTCRR